MGYVYPMKQCILAMGEVALRVHEAVPVQQQASHGQTCQPMVQHASTRQQRSIGAWPPNSTQVQPYQRQGPELRLMLQLSSPLPMQHSTAHG